MEDDFEIKKHHHLDDDPDFYDLDLDDDDFPFGDDDDYEDYWDDDDDIDVVIDSAEGLQVATTFDAEGNVIDVTVTPDEEIEKLDENAPSPLNCFIDHTLLKADATVEQITKLCQEAREYKFASVCVNSCWVRLCSELLRGSGVAVSL